MRKFKWINTVFWGLCFIALILIEAFNLTIMKGNPYISVTFGVFILFTGYLFMCSARNAINKRSQDALIYMEQIHKENAETWMNKYYELEKLQKATYTAAKKGTSILSDQLNDVISRLEDLEININKAWQMITELQKKSLDGQKKALNIEISHMNDNMKHLEEVIRKDNSLDDIHKNIEFILNQLNKDKNNITPEAGIINDNEPDSEEDNTINDNKVNVTPLYDNPNQNLTPDEIASLFASVRN